MILDALNTYSDAQAFTATAASTNIIDHGADRNLGIGTPLCVVILIDVAADGTTGDETYSAQFQTDDNAAFSSPTSVGGAITITRTTAVAGTRYVLPLPPDLTMERFSRINFTLGGTTPLVTLTAFMIPQSYLQNNVDYADAITIS